MAENPKYRIGDVIEVTTGYKTLPGIKDLKPGKYIITDFRDGAFSKVPHYKTYVFVSTRKNSSYRFAYSQEWLEANSSLIDHS